MLDENERQGIIRKVFDYFRNLARSIANRLQQMLRLGRVDVKKAIREMRPDGRSVPFFSWSLQRKHCGTLLVP